MKGSNQSFKSFNDQFSILKKKYLWHSKFWIEFNSKTKNIEIYNVDTMQLHQMLPFPYFDVWSIKWNQEQSLLIAFDADGHQNCVIKQV